MCSILKMTYLDYLDLLSVSRLQAMPKVSKRANLKNGMFWLSCFVFLHSELTVDIKSVSFPLGSFFFFFGKFGVKKVIKNMRALLKAEPGVQ